MAVGHETCKRLDIVLKRLHSLGAPKAGWLYDLFGAMSISL